MVEGKRALFKKLYIVWNTLDLGDGLMFSIIEMGNMLCQNRELLIIQS